MRDLRNKDLFAFVRMVKRAGISDKLKEVIMSVDNISDINAESFGYDLIFAIVDAASNNEAEKEVYSFLSGPLEMEAEEIAEADPVETIEMIKQVATPEKWRAFFQSVASLMKSN